uniref:HATPase_c domain-containing protein n=1 Tax=Strongyloides papillosus TaxID=174720 RepID=A0A0N5CAB6_STREA
MRINQRLPHELIKLIAACEMINRPSNAVKELIENSMDAGTTEINVLVINGGLDLLEVQTHKAYIHLWVNLYIHSLNSPTGEFRYLFGQMSKFT